MTYTTHQAEAEITRTAVAVVGSGSHVQLDKLVDALLLLLEEDQYLSKSSNLHNYATSLLRLQLSAEECDLWVKGYLLKIKHVLTSSAGDEAEQVYTKLLTVRLPDALRNMLGTVY